jgi:6-phosphogluconolactonase/glucosamine-6-phosphate isomerase/deaminase
VQKFAATLGRTLKDNDFRIGLFGIGPDGHTAGILPQSPAVTEADMASGYDAGTFLRITMTPPAIAQLDEAVAYTASEAKWPVLDQLETDIPPAGQPAQFLKQVPAITIYNDHKGEAA